jgi:hypothetical protein
MDAFISIKFRQQNYLKKIKHNLITLTLITLTTGYTSIGFTRYYTDLSSLSVLTHSVHTISS